MRDQQAQATWQIEGMDCPSCAVKIETLARGLKGVHDARVSLATERLRIELDPGLITPEAVAAAIRQAGYRLTGIDDAPPPSAPHRPWLPPAIIGAGLAGAFVVDFFTASFGVWVFAAVTLVALGPIARRAMLSIRAGSLFTIELLMSLAALGALALGDSREAAVVLFLFTVGEGLEKLAASRARSGVRRLMDMAPKTALLIEDGELREVPAASLQPGQLVEIRPGAAAPADGMITKGWAHVDESMLTGESIPVVRREGDRLFAGAIIDDRALTLRVENPPGHNMIDRIIALIENSDANRAQIARFIDRFARFYTPGILVLCGLVMVVPPLLMGAPWDVWIYRGLALMLVGCPCALVLSTPAAVTSALAAAARVGILVKGGAALEQIGQTRTMAFDKTGTLTRGQPQVTDVVALGGSEHDIIALAAGVESANDHPLAQAITAFAKQKGIVPPPASHTQAIAGRAARAEIEGKTVTVGAPGFATEDATLPERLAALEKAGKTVVVVSREGQTLGLIALRDEPREGAPAVIAELAGLGVHSVMLSGDNPRTAGAIASLLGLDSRGGLMPEDKVAEIERLRRDGAIAMVGDGINDAPALRAADVGIAMGGGTDVALDVADAALVHDRLEDVPALVRLSRRTLSNIRANVTLALGLKAVFIVTSITGLTGLWMAVLADTGATVLVTLNALRLLRRP